MIDFYYEKCGKELDEAFKAMEAYHEITTFDIAFEGVVNNTTVAQQKATNNKAVNTAATQNKNAFQSLLSMLQAIITAIGSAIKSLFSNKKIENAEQAIRSNPAKAKTSRFRVVNSAEADRAVMQMNDDYSKMVNKFKSDPNYEPPSAEWTKFTENIGVAAAAVGTFGAVIKDLDKAYGNKPAVKNAVDAIYMADAETSLKVAKSGREQAKRALHQMTRDYETMRNMENHLGAKGAQYYMNSVQSNTKFLSASRQVAKITHDYSANKVTAATDIAYDIAVMLGTDPLHNNDEPTKQQMVRSTTRGAMLAKRINKTDPGKKIVGSLLSHTAK